MRRALLLSLAALLLAAPNPAAGQDAPAPSAAAVDAGDRVQAAAVDPTQPGLGAAADTAAATDPVRLRPRGCDPDTCDGCEEYEVHGESRIRPSRAVDMRSARCTSSRQRPPPSLLSRF